MTKLGEHRNPEEREAEAREIAIDVASSALADFIHTYQADSPHTAWDICEDVFEAVATRIEELRQEAARERQLEEQAEQRGMQY